jgi:hypothetical protein
LAGPVPEFARLIGEAYDLENGINQFAATFAAKLSGRFEVTRCLTTYTQNRL